MNPFCCRTRYNKGPNCSVVRIIDNEVYVFGLRLYNDVNSDQHTDWRNGNVLFYIDNGTERSLNQSVDATQQTNQTIKLPLLIAYEVFNAFKEIDVENKRRVESLFTSEETMENNRGSNDIQVPRLRSRKNA